MFNSFASLTGTLKSVAFSRPLAQSLCGKEIMGIELIIGILASLWLGYWLYAHWSYLNTLKKEENKEWKKIGSPLMPSLRVVEHVQLGKYKQLDNPKLNKNARYVVVAHSVNFYLVGGVVILFPILLFLGVLST